MSFALYLKESCGVATPPPRFDFDRVCQVLRDHRVRSDARGPGALHPDEPETNGSGLRNNSVALPLDCVFGQSCTCVCWFESSALLKCPYPLDFVLTFTTTNFSICNQEVTDTR